MALPKVYDLGKVWVVAGRNSQRPGLLLQLSGALCELATPTPAWLRNTIESVSSDSQMRPLKVLCWRLVSCASPSKPSSRVLCRQYSSKVVTLESLFRDVICQVSLTV